MFGDVFVLNPIITVIGLKVHPTPGDVSGHIFSQYYTLAYNDMMGSMGMGSGDGHLVNSSTIKHSSVLMKRDYFDREAVQILKEEVDSLFISVDDPQAVKRAIKLVDEIIEAA